MTQSIPDTGARARGKWRYRPDIDGLRSIAVGAVLLYHAGVSSVSGGFVGVDIFFVISGYLITGILYSELVTTGRIDFLNFWARRTRRLMPSAIFVIVVSIAFGCAVLSQLQMYYAGRDAIYAATYLTNWQKLIAAIDYFDDESGAGLFLHYWSLAVEEQFYIVLSLLFALVTLIAQRLPAWPAPHKMAAGLISALGLVSFTASLLAIRDAQPIAFFGTHARIWQLAMGASICLIERSAWDPNRFVRHLMAWVGLSMLGIAIVFIEHEQAYPGVRALLPTLGTALLILAGITHYGSSGGRRHALPLVALSSSLPVSIGKISYALYLWHWPVFELYKAHFAQWESSDKAIALAITLTLSVTSCRIIENPIRYSRYLSARPRSSLAVAALITALCCGTAFAVQSRMAKGYIVLPDGMAFDPQKVRRDRPRIYSDKCHAGQKTTSYNQCLYGEVLSPRKIFLIGDSHAAHWFPALERIAQVHGYALHVRTKSACIGVDVVTRNSNWDREYTECEVFREAVYAEMEREHPELVVIGNSSGHRAFLKDEDQYARGEENAQLLIAGEMRSIQRLVDLGAKVALMADMPWLPEDPLDCLVENSPDTDKCRWRESETRNRLRTPWSRTSHVRAADVAVIDLLDHICREGYCYAADGRGVLMRDRHHMTASFAHQLAAALEHLLSSQLGEPAATTR